jgi:hypothetical protein
MTAPSPSPPGESGWQPIATAPKDGTMVMIYDQGDPTPIAVAYWTTSVWVDGGAWVQEEHRSDTYTFNPTHWMPLPTPPST